MSRRKNKVQAVRIERAQPPARKSKAWWTKLQEIVGQLRTPRRTRKLQIVEVASLGEKRFVAVVSFGREKFLIGGAANSVALLTKLGETKPPASEPFRMTLPAQVAL